MSRRTTLRDPGAVMSEALRLANRGYSAEMVARWLLRNDQVLELQRSAGADAARAFAGRTAHKALAYVATRPAARDRGAFLAEIQQRREEADSAPWPGRSGPTLRRVLEGAYETAELARSTAFGLSLRSWAVRTGLPLAVVTRARARLLDVGALSIVTEAERARGRATRYRISPIWNSKPLPLERNYCVTSRRVLLNHDAWRPRALGCIGWLILRRLDAAEVRHGDLAADFGLSRERVYATCGALQRHGLVERRPDGWVRAVTDDELLDALNRIAAQHGTLGTLSSEVGWYAFKRSVDSAWRKGRGARPLPVPVTGLVEDTLDAVEANLEIREAVPA